MAAELVARIFGTGELLSGDRVPRFVYRDHVEVLSPPDANP
jgi:hypothetical protein